MCPSGPESESVPAVSRALGSPIRGGEAFHTGCIPFYKLFQSAVKSCSQGGVRGGAATVYYPLWHLETESLLVLKNNRGVEENRVRHLDYGVQLNRLMYQRLIEGGDITLFSPSDVPGLSARLSLPIRMRSNACTGSTRPTARSARNG